MVHYRQLGIDWASGPDRFLICLDGERVSRDDILLLAKLHGMNVPIRKWVLRADATDDEVENAEATFERLLALGLTEHYVDPRGESLWTRTRIGDRVVMEAGL